MSDLSLDKPADLRSRLRQKVKAGSYSTSHTGDENLVHRPTGYWNEDE